MFALIGGDGNTNEQMLVLICVHFEHGYAGNDESVCVPEVSE